MKLPMYIILEGSDNTGKDTQQKLLIKAFDDKIFHGFHYSSLPFGDDVVKHHKYSAEMYEDMFQLMYENLSNEHRNLIFNRSHLGESVYSPLYRNYSGDFVFDIENKWIDKLKDHLYLVVLTNDPETVFKRDDGLSFYKDVEGVKKEVEQFERAYEMSNIQNKILINVGDKNKEEVNGTIVNFINKVQEELNKD